MNADKNLDVLLDAVTVPPPPPDFLARLRMLPLPVARRRWNFLAFWPLPTALAAAALAGFLVGVVTAAGPGPAPREVPDLATLADTGGDVIVFELMEDLLWPNDSPDTLALY